MNHQLRKDWLIIAIILLPFIILPFFWSAFPDRVAIHFDINGNPNGYAGKGWGLIAPALLNVALYALLVLAPRIDPSKKNYSLFEGPYRIIRLFTHLLLTLVCGVIYAYALSYPMDITTFVLYALPVFFLIVGNYMSTVRPNYFVGVRTPWTLANETVWRRTHRLTGRLWVGASLLMLAAMLFTPARHVIIIILIYTAVLGVVPIIYSYVVFRQLQHTRPEA